MAQRFNVTVSVHRFQFSLRALLVAMLVVAAFFGGMVIQRQLDTPVTVEWDVKKGIPGPIVPTQTMTMPDGSHWMRIAEDF